jgi:hypothetical protein
MRILFFLIGIIATSTLVHAQRRCATTEHMHNHYQANPALKQNAEQFNKELDEYIQAKKRLRTQQEEPVYTIPVVVHVIHNRQNNSIGGNNISDAQILSQIEVLNRDFRRLNTDTADTYAAFKPVAADAKIEFCLAHFDPDGNPTSGIVRKYNSRTSFSINEEDRVKSLSYWPSEYYLNIWICAITEDYLGYAQFPGGAALPGLGGEAPAELDGIVIDYRCFGTEGTISSLYNLGRTTTHEVGHWLGLFHIWGDEYCGTDHVSDTPPQEQATETAFCNPATSRCNISQPAYQHMNQNYMDYSVDKCMNLFTKGQVERMRAVLELSPRRNSLLMSPGCCDTPDKLVLPHKVLFEDDSYLFDGWKITNPDQGSSTAAQWERVPHGAYGQSNYSLRIQPEGVYTGSGSLYVDLLESPYLDLAQTGTPKLDFDLAYAYDNSGVLETDSLVISYRKGCSEVGTPLLVLSGSSLVTTARTATGFVPEVQDWKRIEVDMSSLEGLEFVRVYFEYYSKGKNNLYLDNINFYKNGELDIHLFPVPVRDELNIEVIYPGYRDLSVEIFNTLGEKVREIHKTNTPSFVETLRTTDLASGVYIVRVIQDGQRVTKKFVVF